MAVEGNAVVLDGTESSPAEENGPPIVEHAWSARPGNPAIASVQDVAGLGTRDFTGKVGAGRIVVTLPAVDGEYYFSLRVVDQAGQDDTSTAYVVVSGGQPRLADLDTENMAWVESAIVYGVIPRNFGNQGFQSIAEKLAYLRDLGVNALWLAPVNVSPPGDYGYAVVDYFALNPKYGTPEDFYRLVQEAHTRGIRVLMDFVPNHSSEKHPYFQDTLKYGTASPYWDFYERDETGAPTHYFDWSHLPSLNYDNPEVQRWMIEAFSYWVREFDVDGFRVDVAWGIRQRRPDFWPAWRRELKRIKPDLLLLAEASARDPYYFDDGFDAAYDWTDQLGHWAWERVFETKTLILYNLHSALTNQRRGFHPDALIFRFLNNNDTGTRFVTTYGPEMTRVAAALLLTLPGIPCIYTGDEVGAEFRPYGDPQPIVWEDTYNLRGYYQKLIALRHQVPSLHSRHWQPLEVEPRMQVYGYVRYLEPYTEPVLVLLNFYDQPAEVEIHLPQEFQALAESSSLTDLLVDEEVPVSGPAPLRVPIPALSARILR
jgi:glycosidase